jgi:FKBP-type peptidyl-prolyl cis-trans isomerase
MSAMNLPGIAVLCGLIVLSGCGGQKSEQGAEKAEAPKVDKTAPTTAPQVDKVKITDVKVGTGNRTAAVGDTVYVLYTGRLAKTKAVFDSNAMGGDVFSFTIGQGGVIKGWDDGVPGMKIGGVRNLYIPASLGYGGNEQEKIPANSDLIFDITLLGIVKPGEESVIDIANLKPGSGSRAVKEGDTVTVNYQGRLLNGKVFDDSKGKPPYTFTVGKSAALACIDEGVKGMKVGGVREITSPPQVAFGMKPTKGVPSNSEIVFRIELVSIK